MSTSGTYTYSTTGTAIVDFALRKCGIIAEGETATASMLAKGLVDLEFMTKAWQAEGLHLWKYEEMILFLVTSQQSYDLGPSGGNFVKKADLVTTAVKVAGVSTDLTIDVDSITGISSGDYIGVVIDDNTIHWTTVNGAPAGDTVTLTVALDGAVAVDNVVYAYTAKAPRPLQVTHGRVQVESSSETILNLRGREDYFTLSNKSSAGVAVEAYYNPSLTNGKLYVWPTASDETVYLNLTTQIPIEDFTVASNNPDFPQEWFLPLGWGLAQQIYLDYGVIDQVTIQKIEKEADKWYQKVSDFDEEDTSLVFGIEYSDGR